MWEWRYSSTHNLGIRFMGAVTCITRRSVSRAVKGVRRAVHTIQKLVTGILGRMHDVTMTSASLGGVTHRLHLTSYPSLYQKV
jgi:hypothetical protein